MIAFAMTNTSRPWVVLLLAAAVSCGGGAREDGAPGGEIEGHYVAGEEVSSFVPCGMAADPDYGNGYWLTHSEEVGRRYRAFVDRLSSARGTVYPKVYVRFRGKLSPPGHYGHLNAYEREVTVTELLDMSLDKKCS